MAHHHGGSSGGRGQPPGLSSSAAYLSSLGGQALPLDGRLLTAVSSINSSNSSSNSSNQPLGLHSRPITPGFYAPKEPPVWHGGPRYPSSGNFSIRPPEIHHSHSARDLRSDREHDVRDKRNEIKKATDQAVQQHFDESLRLAEQKRWSQQWKQSKQEDDKHARPLLASSVPVNSAGVIGKQYYAPPIEISKKSMVDSSPSSMFPKIESGSPRNRDTTTSSVPRREQIQDRNYYSPPGNHIKSGYNYSTSPLPRAKVSSPAPPQIYGKPDARITSSPNVPSTHFDSSDIAPLQLTSKGASVARDSPPVTSSSASLPQHEVRSADIADYYMSYPGPSNYRGGNSPLPQTKPLDLVGAKRKPEHESIVPPSLEPKKVKNEEMPLDLKPKDAVINLSTFSQDIKHQADIHSVHGNQPKVVAMLGSAGIKSEVSACGSKNVNSLISSTYGEPFNFSLSTSVTAALIAKPTPLPTQPVIIPQPLTNPPTDSVIVNPRQEATKVEPVAPQVDSTESNAQEANNQAANSPSASQTVHKLKKHWLIRHSGDDGVNSGESSLNHRSLSPSSSKLVTSGKSSFSKDGSDKSQSSNSSTSTNGQTAYNQKGNGGKKTSIGKHRKEGTRDNSPSGANSGNSCTESNKTDNFSSGSEDDYKARKNPRRNNGKEKNRNTASESESGSYNESDSESSSSKGKDTQITQPAPQAKKRGRKPKDISVTSPKNDPKKQNPFKRKSIKILKKTMESFLQDGSCNEVASKLGKCRECRWSSSARSKKQTHPFCRFYAFRKLRYTKNGQLAIAGFSNPFTDASEEEQNLWLPSKENLPKCLEFEMSKSLVSQLGDQFCELVREENDAIELNLNSETKAAAAWKRVISGVRDMCDVCETTLFNFHWACGKCGFVVCIACYQSRRNNSVKVYSECGKERDKYQWLLCSNRQSHELDKLMLTQAIAGDSLNKLGKMLHKMRDNWNIPQRCNCPEACLYVASKDKTLEQPTASDSNGVRKTIKEEKDGSSSSDESDPDDDNHSTLRDLLSNSVKSNDSGVANDGCENDTDEKKLLEKTENVDNSTLPSNLQPVDAPNSLKHFVRPTASNYHRQLLPIRLWTLSESSSLYPDLPHSWLCAGRLLRLENPGHARNVELFQDVWKRGQPVLVGNIDTRLDKVLWTPEAFSKDFSDLKSDLVNCISGKTLANQSIKKFWDGFDYVKKRLLDDKGNPMLLKLKDWPPGEDFAELLPARFKDLMAALPMTDYTDRNGRLNLAARLPTNFVKPDLGPKMYIAYGSGMHLDKGTTNLHLDISDAVNVMVHVGVPKDIDNTDHMNIVRDAIMDSDCDKITIQKVLEKGERAGALWHIYNSRDADKIRDLLNKVAMERGDPLEPNHDPIHDQSWYLDRPLRKRLMDEYDVSGYPIVQCLGDAVFIPAGAPHQVRNLNNCIKIAEDFVSPENVSHCFDLTEEFRRLSDTHQNHEDKLQIKNIIYHAVKDAVSVLMYGNNTSEASKEIPAVALNPNNSISSE